MIMVYYKPILKMNPYTVRTTGPGFIKICLFISWKVEKKQRKSEKSIFSLAFSGMNEYTFTC